MITFVPTIEKKYLMSIHYEVIPKADYLLVKARGFDENLEEVETYGKNVIDACLKHAVKKVLADERELEYRISKLDTYELAKFYEEFLPTLIKVAIVFHPDFKEDAEFWETASMNRGLQFRAFTSVEKAEEWLLKD